MSMTWRRRHEGGAAEWPQTCIEDLMQTRRNSSALAMELRLLH